MSAGLNDLSDADLLRMLGQPVADLPPSASPAPAPSASPLGHLSNEELMRQLDAAPAEKPSGILATAKDLGRSFEEGVTTGVAGAIGAPHAIMGLVDKGAGFLIRGAIRAAGGTPTSDLPGGDPRPSIADGFPSPEAVEKSMRNSVVVGEAYKPRTTAGEVAKTVGEFASNALLPGSAVQRVAQVVAPALASEGAGRAAREVAPEYEGAARLAGALAGGVGAAVAQAPRGAAAVGKALDGFSPEDMAKAEALRAEARALPGGGLDLGLDEALNHVTGGQAQRLTQLARAAAATPEGQRVAGNLYADRPRQVDAIGRAAFDALGEPAAPGALGGAVQDAARGALARTPEGTALAEARAAAGPRVTAEEAGQTIQPALRQAYERREGMRAALGEQDYAAARNAPEGVGIERQVTVERPGEPVVTQPQGRPQFTDAAPRPLEAFRRPVAEAAEAGPESLARFVARNGGLRLDGDVTATDLHRFNIPGLGTVARQGGKGIDDFWREHLIDHGYLRPDADGGAARDITSELLRKLQNEQRGVPSYPVGVERGGGAGRSVSRQADEYAEALSTAEARLDQDLRAAGVPPESVHPDIRSRTLGALMRGEAADPLTAYGRVVDGMREPPAPYVRSTTVAEQIPDVRFGQVNPTDVLAHVETEMRAAKGPVAVALQQARKTLFEPDGKTLDLSVAGLHGARTAISDLIDKATPQAQRALLSVRDRLDRALAAVPEYETARAGFEAASRNLDPFAPGSAPGRIVAQDQASGRFTMPAEQAAGAISEGPSAARAFREVASPEALAQYEGRLTTHLLDGATDAATGEVSGKVLRSALRANEDLLGQFPAVRERLQNVAVAREGMAAVERSPLGRMAEKPSVKRAIGTLFDPKPLAGSEAEVGAAMRELARSDPGAARQLARIHLETVFNDAVRETRGLPAQYGGAGFASAVAGNPQQARNLEAAIRALPEGDTLWSGFDRFVQALRATGHRPGRGGSADFEGGMRTALAGGGTVREAVGNVVTGATAGGTAFGAGGAAGGALLGAKKAAADAWTRYQVGRNGEAVARILFDPKAMPDLRALAKSKPGSKNADLFTGRLLALAGGANAPGERRP